MKYAGGSCPSRAGRLSKAGLAIMKRQLLGAAAAVACAGMSAALADTNVLPDPFFYVSGPQLEPGSSVPIPVAPGAHSYDFTLSEQEGYPSGTSATESVQLTGEPFPAVSASVEMSSSSDCCNQGPEIYAGLSYDVEFTGPAPDVLVDVSGWYGFTISTYYPPSAPGAGQAFAFLSINGADSVPGAFRVDSPPPSGTTSTPFSETLSLPTGTEIPVSLEVEAMASAYLPGNWSASAYIDPYFSINPSNADASAYSILVSPGVGNAPSPGIPGAPEPSTWAMLLLGFAGLGWAGWRRGRVAKARSAFRA